MEQLLQITTIPVTFEMRVQNAKLEYKASNAELEISRSDNGGLKIKSRPIKLNMDTYEARNSVAPTTLRSVEQAASKGRSAAYQATAQYASEGNLYINAKMGQDVIDQIVEQRNPLKTGQFELGFTPKSGPNIDWDPAEFTMKYEMDKLNFDLKTSNGNFEFTPGDIQMVMTQQPDVKIEYIGKPLYVPPSAAERYIDLKA